MRKRWLAVVTCLVIGATFALSLGCTAERSATAANSIRGDLNQIPDDLLWVTGLDESSILHEDTFPPYHNPQ